MAPLTKHQRRIAMQHARNIVTSRNKYESLVYAQFARLCITTWRRTDDTFRPETFYSVAAELIARHLNGTV